MGYLENKTSPSVLRKKQKQRKKVWRKSTAVDFRESSIQLVIDMNYCLNLLILTIKNRPNDISIPQKFAEVNRNR